MEYELDLLVIGAGVAGLATGREVALSGRCVGILEKNRRYGLETSSRNSEVIHSGIHYPPGSLKALLCVEGNRLLYDYCAGSGILHRKTGKITLAVTPEEEKRLWLLYKTGLANGVKDIKILGAERVKEMVPCVECRSGLFTGSTGILSAHSLMNSLYGDFLESGGIAGFGEEVTGIEKAGRGYRVATAAGKHYTSRAVINCAGLFSDKISGMISMATVRTYWAKGDYFGSGRTFGINMPVYPVPGRDYLGIHLTPDVGGGLKAGPDIEYVEKSDHPYPGENHGTSYSVDERKRERFFREVRRYLPSIREEDLSPAMFGIRSRLQGPGDGPRDFLISAPAPGFINLEGIDSPGLTGCLAIGKYARNIFDVIIRENR